MSSNSEFSRLKSVFINRAQDTFLSQEKIDAEWKELNFLERPNLTKAIEEYQGFENLIKKCGTDIHYFPPRKDLSIDAIYCRDASIATASGMILCNMGKAGRIQEPHAQKEFYQKQGIKILGEITAPGTLEGGDVAWLDDKTLAVGHTYRSNKEGIRQLRDLLHPLGIEVIVANLPHYRGPSDVFHLMSILSPVDKDLAVVYSPLMPINFRNLLLERGMKLIEVPEEEFDSMGCNVLALAPQVCLMVKGNPITKERLEKAGCTVYEYEGMEISVKGGGGPTCLTRPWTRE
jgi:N-dimethylarginine dimethylaminohydrolase